MRSGVRIPLGPRPQVISREGTGPESRLEVRRSTSFEAGKAIPRRTTFVQSVYRWVREPFAMWDDKRRDRVFWGAAGLAVGLFIWVYSHSPNGEGDFADSPPSLAPSAAVQVASPSPVSEIPAVSPSPASPGSSDAAS